MSTSSRPMLASRLTRPVPSESRAAKTAGLLLLAAAAAVATYIGQVLVAGGSLAQLDIPAVLMATMVATNLAGLAVTLLLVGCGGQNPLRDSRRRHALGLRVVLTNLLVPALAYGLLTSDTQIEAELAQSGLDTLASGVGLVLLLLAGRLFKRSRQWEAPDAVDAMARDPRPPVLYLRSFHDDEEATLVASDWAISRRLGRLMAPYTPEQEMAEVLEHVGPVVAIGRPGEPLPELGAARLYVSDTEWQDRVLALMRQSALVVLRIGASAGVRWEIEQALREIPRHRLVLVLIGDLPADVVSALVELLGPELRSALPAPRAPGVLGRLWNDPRKQLGGLVCFDEAGRPHGAPVKLWPLWGRDILLSMAYRPSALPLRRAWRGVFSHLGMDAGVMSADRSRPVAVVLAALCGWCGAHWFYLGQTRRGWTYLGLTPVLLLSVFLGWRDALRFVWIDRRTFDGLAATR